MVTNKIIYIILFAVLCLSAYFYSKQKTSIKNYTALESKIENVKLLKIADGDTITVLLNNKKERVRIIGINSLELNTKSALAYKAKEELKKLLKNERVDLEINPFKKRDKYGRILAKVYRASDKLWVEGFLLENGLAVKYIFESYGFDKAKLIEKENIAKKNKKGIWQNSENTIINAKNSFKHINSFKVIEGKITSIKYTKKDVILILEDSLSVVFNKKSHNFKIGSYISVRGNIRKTKKYGLRIFTSLSNIDSL